MLGSIVSIVDFSAIVQSVEVIVVVNIALFRLEDDATAALYIIGHLTNGDDVAVVGYVVAIASFSVLTVGLQPNGSAQGNNITGGRIACLAIDNVAMLSHKFYIAIDRL